MTNYGIADAEAVDSGAREIYTRWTEEKRHGTMNYMERYGEVRDDPRQLLDGAQSIICCAFPYHTPTEHDENALKIARYAMGKDYHDVVRARLEAMAEAIRTIFGGNTRVCVDTAPLRERYWAVQSGLGFIGLNNQLIVPGAGSYFFLGEILTTERFRPTEKKKTTICEECGRCVKACPAGALDGRGGCDTSRCLSYLTIEYRGEFREDTDLHGWFYGCDRCAEVCPHNSNPSPCTIDEFRPNPRLLHLTADEILAMDHEEYATLFRGSAMKRAKLSGLQRNAMKIKSRHTDSKNIGYNEFEKTIATASGPCGTASGSSRTGY